MGSREEPVASASSSLSASQSRPGGNGHALIRPRRRVGVTHVLLFSLIFAAVGAAIALADALFVDADALVVGEASPITVRLPTFAGYRSEDTSLAFGGVLLERGDVATAVDVATASEMLKARPRGVGGWAMFAAGLLVFCVFFSSALRSCHRGKLVRHQLVLLSMILLSMAAIKAATVFTAVSILAMPVATFALLARASVDRASATATALFAAFAVGSLVPFDPGVITVLVAQALTPALILGSGRDTKRRMLLGALAGGGAAVAAYFAYALLYWGSLPALELASLHKTGAFAALIGGVASGPLAVLMLAPFQVVLGEVTANRLVVLEDFSNPLLQQIAERSPGSWQHSLAMANMAETAANALGANGRLVRTGAYYHDLGKSLQPKYFIENLAKGEPSPHDSLAPEVSADVIFAHVTEGVRLGRKHGLPERIIDFMHMHHGDGRLEYFWTKCQELGNPNALTEDAFRYPGLRPQSKETAVLAIVDAVEAASRTLRKADDKNIRNLVQRIVYGKLHLGQLDESGLTMSDLRRISESLVTTIKHAHHGRIEYPWQREQAAAEAASSEADTRSVRPPSRIDTGRIQGDVRLDSLDAPRPGWRRASTQAEMLDSSASIRALADRATDGDARVSPVPSETAQRTERASPVADAEIAETAAAPVEPAAMEPAAAESPAAEPSEPERSASSNEDTAPQRGGALSAREREEPPAAETASMAASAPKPNGAVSASVLTSAPAPAPAAGPSGSGAKRLPPALIIEDSVPSAPIPRPAPASIPIEASDPAILGEQDVEAVASEAPAAASAGPVIAPAGPPPPPPSGPAPSTIMSDESEHTEPRAPVVRARSGSNTGRLAEWEEALEAALPPPVERRPRPGRNTLALLKSRQSDSVLEPLDVRDASEPAAVSLSPGTMVVGPPPETQPRATKSRDTHHGLGDETLEVRLPIPDESVRPSKRQTAERDIVPPPEAFPDDTEPSGVAVLREMLEKGALEKLEKEAARKTLRGLGDASPEPATQQPDADAKSE